MSENEQATPKVSTRALKKFREAKEILVKIKPECEKLYELVDQAHGIEYILGNTHFNATAFDYNLDRLEVGLDDIIKNNTEGN